jgi:hypothetical protein
MYQEVQPGLTKIRHESGIRGSDLSIYSSVRNIDDFRYEENSFKGRPLFAKHLFYEDVSQL